MHVLFVGGPSGTGKTTVKNELASELRIAGKKCVAIEGDDWHSEANIIKMQNGIPLSDEDRWPWLEKLTELVVSQPDDSDVIIVSCSMLKKSYRDFIKSKLSKYHTTLVILSNDYETVLKQMKARKNHFFKESMLKSQYDSFEKPDVSIESNVRVVHCNGKTPSQIAHEIKSFI